MSDIAEDELYEMVNLRPLLTGLPMTVWARPHGNAQHDVSIKVNMAPGALWTRPTSPRFETPLGLGTVHFAKPARSSRYSHPRSTGAVAASAQRCSRTEFSGWVRRCSLNVRQQGVQPEGPPAPLCSQDHDQMPARCQMRRRELLLMATAMMGAPAVRAQLKAIPVVGFLGSTGPGPYALNMAAFREGLAEAGYVDGPDVALEYRWAEDHYDRLPGLAADLVDRKVNVIATGSMPSALAAKQATSTSPSSSRRASTQSRRALSPASLGQAGT